MSTTTVSKRALREAIRSMFDSRVVIETMGTIPTKSAIKPDESTETQVDPTDSDVRDRESFDSAVEQLTKDVPNDELLGVLDRIKVAIASSDEEKPMIARSVKAKRIEEAVRMKVRSIIKEMWSTPGLADMMTSDEAEDETDADVKREPKKRRHISVVDVEGMPLKDVATEIDASVAGVRRIEMLAMQKLKFLMGTLEDEDRQELEDNAVYAYIDALGETGAITGEDVEFMRENSDMVKELEGWRNFYNKYVIPSAMKKAGTPLGFAKDEE